MSVVAQFEIEYLQYLDAVGHEVRADLPDFASDLPSMVQLYKTMFATRVFDAKAIALQRTGKIGTFSSCLGHEATYVGIGAAMQPQDVFAPSYREHGVQLYRGLRPREMFLFAGGDERGNDYQVEPCSHDLPTCIPISTQCTHAAGAALAFKIRNEKRVAVATVGDGGTSKGDFYGAINLAGARGLPLVVVIVNNQWAISVPRQIQTGAQTLAQKAVAAGLPGIQVDGNDVIAVRKAVGDAVERARVGGGGGVVECLTYRIGDHTTADDATRYRSEEEVDAAWQKEPIARLRKWLQDKSAWDDAREQALQDECSTWINAEVQAYEATEPPALTDMFDYTFASLPDDLKAQRAQAVALQQEGR